MNQGVLLVISTSSPAAFILFILTTSIAARFRDLFISRLNPRTSIMLILVAGITGFVGIPVAKAALERGYQVRGLARNPDRLPKGLLERLESFETLTGPHDIAALERAVAGVDAVVSTISATPELIMETQVLLLKAAERAGVKVWPVKAL
jgi:NADP-dependent 3-hydroxy acid dehydrogenase YdfG